MLVPRRLAPMALWAGATTRSLTRKPCAWYRTEAYITRTPHRSIPRVQMRAGCRSAMLPTTEILPGIGTGVLGLILCETRIGQQTGTGAGVARKNPLQNTPEATGAVAPLKPLVAQEFCCRRCRHGLGRRMVHCVPCCCRRANHDLYARERRRLARKHDLLYTHCGCGSGSHSPFQATSRRLDRPQYSVDPYPGLLRLLSQRFHHPEHDPRSPSLHCTGARGRIRFLPLHNMVASLGAVGTRVARRIHLGGRFDLALPQTSGRTWQRCQLTRGCSGPRRVPPSPPGDCLCYLPMRRPLSRRAVREPLHRSRKRADA